MDWLSILVGSALILAIQSYLWRDNEIFQLATNIAVGASIGNVIVNSVYSLWNVAFLQALKDATYIIPILIGFLLLARYVKRLYWIYILPIGLIVGTTTGLMIRSVAHLEVIRMIGDTMILPITLDNSIYIIGIFTVLAYFIFEKPVADFAPIAGVRKIGYVFIMAFMGIGYTNAVWGRVSMFASPLQQYILLYPGYYLIPVAVILILIAILRGRQKKT